MKNKSSYLQNLTPEKRKAMCKKAAKTRSMRAKIKSRFPALKAIRYKCLDCSAGSIKEVKLCSIYECSLWEYRFGKRPTKEMAEKVEKEPVFGKDI